MNDRVIIDISDVTFTYPDGHAVLKGITTQIKRGDKVALIGPGL